MSSEKIKAERRARTAALRAGTPLPQVPTTGCGLEGNVLELCHTCGGANGARHVRECDHPDNPTGKCTRGFVSDRVWSCSNCVHRTEANDG